MKRIYLLFLTLVLCAVTLTAQTSDNRTIQTIVADVLSQMPTNNEADFNKQISDLVSTGEEGVFMIVRMMHPPGPQSNAAMEYALSGLSHFSTREGNEALRERLERTFIKSLDLTSEREVKLFIMRQLQTIGGAETVRALSPLLNIEEYSGTAARVLASIGGEEATKAMQGSLLRRMGTPKSQRDVILAIGEAQLPVDENLLKTMLGKGDEDFQKDLLYTLSRIGSKSSLKELEAEAEKVGFSTDKTGANEAYILLLERVVQQGDVKEVKKAAGTLLKNATEANQTHTRGAALKILLSIEKEKGIKLVQNALKDPSIEYRNASLDYISPYTNSDIYAKLIGTMVKAAPEVKVDILNWLGREASSDEKRDMILNSGKISGASALQTIIKQLDNNNFAVKEAAVWATVKLGDASIASVLPELLTEEDDKVAQVTKTALTSIEGDVLNSAIKVIPRASDAGKVAILELLALRRSSDNQHVVLEQIDTGSEKVKSAAYNSLKSVVTDEDFKLMCVMLEGAPKSAISPLQQAVIATIRSQSKEDQISVISERMKQSGESKKHLYYVVLASTGDKEVFGTIVKAFNDSRGDAKDAAFEALLSWRGVEAAEELFAICNNPATASYFDRAIEGYARLISGSSLTGENKAIFLRNAMEIAKTDEQRESILNRIGRIRTFSAMLYTGLFLDDEALQQIAADAVINTALSRKEYTGEMVRDLLSRAAEILDTPDAEYQREAVRKHLEDMPSGEGYVSMFNGKDLTGWKGLVENPIKRAKMTPDQMAQAQKKADEQMRKDWRVENGLLLFDGTGYDNICTEKQYGDFEMYVDWMLDPAGPEADAGIYLRGTPQVQMWDIARTNVGAQVGSGGLYNNKVNQSKPLKVADNKLGEWNTMFIRMIGDRVTVYLNGELVTDNVILENYWDRKQPIFPMEQIELQAHGSKVYYRNIYIKELEREEPFALSQQEEAEGYKVLFDGSNMFEWVGNTTDYTLNNGTITLVPSKGSGGNLYTKDEYDNFIFRFEFMLTPAANNGLGIRTPMEGDAAYVGMELQILDNEHAIYSNLKEYQYHGSVYGVIPAKRGYLKPTGEWNYQEVIANGDYIKITLNGEVILEGNIREASKNGTKTIDNQEHPGLLNKKGHIGFLGHGSEVKFRNIRIKEL